MRPHTLPRIQAKATRIVLRVALLTCVACWLQPAQAGLALTRVEGTADASAMFFGTSLPPATDSASFGPFGGAAIAEVGRTRAVQTGSGFNAVSAEGHFGDIPEFKLRAQTSIDQRVTNTGAVDEALAFQYLINGGDLRLFSPTGSFNGLEATVAVSIFVLAPGFSGFLWDWGVTLRGVGSTVESAVHGFAPIFPLNDPLGLGTPTISPITVAGSEAMLSIAAFTAPADLGPLSPASTASLTYTMYAEVSGPAFNNTGGRASVGDPFDFSSNPGSVISIPGATPVVPEPASALLMLIGSAALSAVGARMRGRSCTALG